MSNKEVLKPLSAARTHRAQRQGAGSKSAKVGAGTKNTPPLPAAQARAIQKINRLLDELRATTRLTLEKAIDLGGRLVKLKDSVGSGRWLLFVKQNLPFCDRTADRYMRVYHNRAQLKKFDTLSNLKVSDAYELLSRKKEKKTVSDPRNGETGDGYGEGGAPDKSALLPRSAGVCATGLNCSRRPSSRNSRPPSSNSSRVGSNNTPGRGNEEEVTPSTYGRGD